MGYKLHDLPPLKRLRLLHQDHTPPPLLPTKKRKEPRYQSPDSSDIPSSIGATATRVCFLPTKKRVWAPPPDFIPEVTSYSIDLNIEYKPAPNDGSFDHDLEEKGEVEIVADGSFGCDNEAVEKPDDDREEKGDDELVEIGVDFVNDESRGADSKAVEDFEEEKEDKDGELAEVEVEIVAEGQDYDREEKEDGKLIENEGAVVDDESCGADGKGVEDVEEEEDDGIVCAICNSTDGDPQDPIVFCDGCDLTVHASCYGNPLVEAIPVGDWFCSQCLASKSSHKEKIFSCCLCPVTRGAMKQTNDGKWAHIVCALFVPEVFFADPVGREGVNCSEVPKRRWKEKCYVCGGRNGCAIECSEVNCGLGFHVSCGLKEGLCIEYREGKRKSGIVAGFCKEHTALWELQQRTGKFKIVSRGR
ncbi:hypothetical protein Droror1_Dr00014108 [Drosera rotundifolia]